MTQPDAWTIIFYTSPSGASPVVEFLEGLDQLTQNRLAAAIEQLRVRNVTARFPLVRPLEGKLWELRVESRTNIFRIVYVFVTGRQIVLLHGFAKKRQQTPRRELATAAARLADYEAREGG